MQKSKSKGKSKAASTRWGEWSEWGYDERGFWYRARQDTEGTFEYDYDQNDPRPASATTPRARGHDPVDEITEGIQGLSPSSGQYDEEYKVSSGGRSRSRDRSKRDKGKGHRRDYAEDGVYSDEDRRQARPSSHYDAQVIDEQQEEYGYPPTGAAGYPTGDASYYGSAYEPSATASHASYSESGGTGYSYDVYDHASAYGGRPADEGGRSTPKARPNMHAQQHITAGAMEPLDPRYRVERSEKFEPGEIFKVSWAEPKGFTNDSKAPLSVSGLNEIQDSHGTPFFVGFRRFIVIANDHGHCTCVPILTYSGKACTKKGVKPEKHGVIHQSQHSAKLLSKEPKLGFPPVRADITAAGEKLSRESRVNYSKLVTVEHNVKVLFIGTVVLDDWQIVSDAIGVCWAKKTLHKTPAKTRGY